MIHQDLYKSFMKGSVRICNNPFNIKYNVNNNWLGQTGERRGFVVFSSISYGLRAGVKLLYRYIFDYGLTDIPKIIERFSPRSDNKKLFDSKLRYILDSVGSMPVTSMPGLLKLCQSLVVIECSVTIDLVDFCHIVGLLNLKFESYEEEDCESDT